MADWYAPPSDATKAACVAQIVTDITANIVTNADGQVTLDMNAFMALAATRMAAIPDPLDPTIVYVQKLLVRGVDVRPFADQLVSDLGAQADAQVGAVDVAALLADLETKSADVTAYYDKAYSVDTANLLISSMTSGAIDQNMPAADDTTPETRYYRTTFVNDWENESAPSDVSDPVVVGPKDTVTGYIGAVPAGRNLAYWRAYRSNSGNEAAAFQYTVGSNPLGVPIATTNAVDNVRNSALKEVCPSTLWNEPPSNLQGLIGIANEMTLGFFDNVLCPSIPGKPFAFPIDYRLTVGWPIVALAPFRQGAFVATRGHPYFVFGADAASLTAEVIENGQACVSARSVCPTEDGVVYASPDGLMLATQQGVRNLTESHFTREEWQALNPSNLIVQVHDGALYLFTPDPALIPLNPAYMWFYANGGGSISSDKQTWTYTIAGGGVTAQGRSQTAISGKVYCEFKCTAKVGTTPIAFGITSALEPLNYFTAGAYDIFTGVAGANGNPAGYVNYGVLTNNSAYSFAVGDVIGIAVDATAGKIWYSKNGTWISGDPASGTSPTATFTPGTWFFYVCAYSYNVSAGTYTALIQPTNTAYTAPTGFGNYQPS